MKNETQRLKHESSARESVIECLAQRLHKCPFDQQFFDSSNSVLGLRLHLCESHAGEICQSHRISRPEPFDSGDRPRRLYCCLHCDFAAAPGNAIASIIQYITTEHPNSQGPAIISFRTSEDEDVIDRFVDQQGTIEVRICNYPDCRQIFDDEARIAEHWVETHSDAGVMVEDARNALESNPERFRTALAECLAEVAEEEVRRRLSIREPDDGYEIHHSPSVPRVRSAPSESIIYVEREAVSQLDREIEELFGYEGLDFENEVQLDQYQTVRVELRSCNINDGYIPLVKEVRSILPLLADGEIIEVCWRDEPNSWFPCKVSRSKRAIYNLDGILRRLFKPLLSGVWLYVTRVETRRYKIGPKRQPHTVANCKVFTVDDDGRWSVLRRDEFVEWETSEHVFKHQLNFTQMEALHDEAQRTGLSIKDAVYQVMKRLGQNEAAHVRDVYDVVFWRMRTCSLAAVWAQFRAEHECYVRVRSGSYRFDSNALPPPIIRPLPMRTRREDALQPTSRQTGRYAVRQRSTWRFNVFKSRFEEAYQEDQNACLEVYCLYGTPKEILFITPIRWLMQHVFPHAHCHDGGRYMFSVDPHDFVFTWDYAARMQGTPFLNRAN